MTALQPGRGGLVWLRQAGPGDAAMLAALQALCACQDPHLESWAVSAWQALLTDRGAIALLAGAAAEEAAGFALVRVACDESEIYTIGVRPDRRRRGLARVLLEQASRLSHEAGARVLFLEVACSNAAAIALYRETGFELAGRRPDYYRKQGVLEDALVMVRPLYASSPSPGHSR